MGVPVEVQDYGSFGEVRLNDKSESFDSQRKYIGEMYDSDTGLNYLNARYYNASIGRFISQDPVFLAIGDNNQIKQITGKDQQTILADPQSLNSYTYAENNPIVKSDPSGKCPICIVGIGALAMYAPQITSFAQSLLTPMGQYGLSQAVQEAKQGNYGWAAFGFATAGDVSSKGYKPVFEGLWSVGSKESRVANAAFHALKAGNEKIGHAAEFGLNNTVDYIKATREFITEAINKGFPTKLESREGIDILRTYDKSSNTFSAFEVNKITNGVAPRTMFKLDTPNTSYLNSQPGHNIKILDYFKK